MWNHAGSGNISLELIISLHFNLTKLKYFCINHGDRRYFPICNHHKCVVSSFRFIWILIMVWVYGHYKFLILLVMTSKDGPRTERVKYLLSKTVDGISGLHDHVFLHSELIGFPGGSVGLHCKFNFLFFCDRVLIWLSTPLYYCWSLTRPAWSRRHRLHLVPWYPVSVAVYS